MNLDQRKLRLIRFISELEDETFFDYIESVIESSGERFGLQLCENQENSDDLLTRFYAITSDFEDEETREHILRTEFTDDERFTILLLLRAEDAKNHPEQMIDGETFIKNLKKHKKHETT